VMMHLLGIVARSLLGSTSRIFYALNFSATNHQASETKRVP